MKLRIRGNSLRLRLTRTEMAGLVGCGFVENRVQLGRQPGCALVYRLELSDTLTKPTTVFADAKICIRLPAVEARNWARNETVGIYAEESWGLKLAIEKDFKCLDPRLGEDESDAFANPAGVTHTHCPAA